MTNVTYGPIRMGRLKIYCSGCMLKKRIEDVNSLAHCIIATYNKHDDCPCIECLVKIMCREKSECSDRVDFIANMDYSIRSVPPNLEYPNVVDV
jgi:hypothetical protein